MDVDEIAKFYAENIDCPDCRLVQECYFENGEVFSEEKCAEFIKKKLIEREAEKEGVWR